MLHAYFYIPTPGNGNQNNERSYVVNFMHIYDQDHSNITGKPYLASEQNETENAEAGNSDFISLYDFFGAVNY